MTDRDHLTHAEWAAALREGRLLGQSCPDCGHVAGAPKAACAHCGSRAVETVELPTEGTVYSETTVAVSPDWFDEAGYQVALVSVGDARVMARIADEGDGDVDGDGDGDVDEHVDVDVGDPVEFAGPLEAIDEPGPVFEPI